MEDEKKKRVHELEDLESQNCVHNFAFVIFETRDGKDACLRAYDPFRMDLDKQPENMRYHGTPVIVSHAPEPREIFWENVGVSWGAWRSYVSYAIIISLMIGTFVWISYITRIEIKLPTYSMCLSDDQVDITSNNASFQQVSCFCGGIEETKIDNNPSYSQFCSRYDQEFYQLWFLRLVCITSISFINLLLKYCVMGIFPYKKIRSC